MDIDKANRTIRDCIGDVVFYERKSFADNNGGKEVFKYRPVKGGHRLCITGPGLENYIRPKCFPTELERISFIALKLQEYKDAFESDESTYVDIKHFRKQVELHIQKLSSGDKEIYPGQFIYKTIKQQVEYISGPIGPVFNKLKARSYLLSLARNASRVENNENNKLSKISIKIFSYRNGDIDLDEVVQKFDIVITPELRGLMKS